MSLLLLALMSISIGVFANLSLNLKIGHDIIRATNRRLKVTKI